MLKTLITVLLFSFTSSLWSQVGISYTLQANSASEWNSSLVQNANSFGIDYWARLNNYRVEFLPEINYASYTASDPKAAFDARFISIFANVQIYPFDLQGDCNCPTFSKSNPIFKKGFFFKISPGYSYFNLASGNAYSSEDYAFSIAGGMGIDMGFSEVITLSPSISYRYFPEIEAAGVSAFLSDETIPDKTSLSQIFASVRLGIRFDYK